MQQQNQVIAQTKLPSKESSSRFRTNTTARHPSHNESESLSSPVVIHPSIPRSPTAQLHDRARNRNTAALHPVALEALPLSTCSLRRLNDALGDGSRGASWAVVVDEGAGGSAGHFCSLVAPWSVELRFGDALGGDGGFSRR